MKLNTGISPNYVKGWDSIKALRELIQNNLDSRQEFGCFGRILWRDGFVKISDSGPGLEMKHLALGISEKSDTAKGQFGEGLKLALLVLAREGREVEIQTKGYSIRPAIEFNEAFGTDILVLHTKEISKTSGTIIRAECSEFELMEAKSYFIEYISQNPDFHWMEKGRISLPGGFVYVNGTRVGKLEGAMYSYHLSGKIDVGNRDREVVDSNKMKPYIQSILRRTTSQTVLAELFQAATQQFSGVAEVDIGIGADCLTSTTRKRWKAVLQKIFDLRKTLMSEGIPEEDFYAESLGYKVIHIRNWSWAQAMRDIGMKSTHHLSRRKVTNIGQVAMAKLTKEEDANLRRAKRLIKKHYRPVGSVKVVESVKGLAAEDDGIDGYYDSGKDRIFLVRKVLANPTETLRTLLHETVHKYSGASDNTREFEWALLDVAVGIIERGGKKVGWK